jgi:hypothetical protein
MRFTMVAQLSGAHVLSLLLQWSDGERRPLLAVDVKASRRVMPFWIESALFSVYLSL